LKHIMTDYQKGNTSKTVDDGHMAAQAAHDDVKVNAHTIHKDAEVKTQGATIQDKSGSHKDVSADPKSRDHNMHKDAEMKTHDAPAHEKTGVHKDVSADPKSRDHNMHKDAEVKTQDASGHEKTGVHKDMSADPKSNAHTMHKDAEVKAHDVAGHEKTGVHKDVSADPKVAAQNRKEMYAQISGALAGAKFPLETAADLISAFPKGAATRCHAGEITMTAGEAGKLLTSADYPFTSAKAVADMIVQRASL